MAVTYTRSGGIVSIRTIVAQNQRIDGQSLASHPQGRAKMRDKDPAPRATDPDLERKSFTRSSHEWE